MRVSEPRLVLASASPRRKELLHQLGINCVVQPANIDESHHADETPTDYVRRLTLAKARLVFDSSAGKDPVLGADTVVVAGAVRTSKAQISEQILGKPVNKGDALRMLSMLSDNTHKVLSGAGIVCPDGERSVVVCTEVTFSTVTLGDATRYWETGEPVDKAGAYAIQGRGSVFVRSINGSYSNVVGLPLFETRELLAYAGIELFEPG